VGGSVFAVRMRRLASGGKWRWLPGSGLGGADAASRRAGDASSGQGDADAAAISPAREEQMWWRGTSDSSSTAKHIFQMLEAIVGRVIVLWRE